MQTDFRRRVFTPVVLPVTVLGGILLVAWSLAQVMLVVPAAAAAAIAFGLALYVLIIASLVASRRKISSRALTISLSVGLLALVAAGAVARAAGPREIGEHGAEHGGEGVSEGGGDAEDVAAGEGGGEAGGGEGGGGEGGGGEGLPPDAAVFVAVDIAYESAPETLPADSPLIGIDNQGNVVHNVVFEGVNNDEPVVEAEGGQTDSGPVTLAPGAYTYYCSIPGHRAAGMEGELTAE